MGVINRFPFRSGCLLPLITFFVLFGTLLIPVTVHDRSELAQVHLGYPFHFVSQDLRARSIGTSDSGSFPWSTGMLSFFENPVHILWGPLVIDCMMVGGAIWAGLSRLLPHRRSLDGLREEVPLG